MVLMVQMVSMRRMAEGRGAGVSGHDLPTDAGFATHTEALLPTGFQHATGASTSLLAEERFSTTSREEREGADVEVKIGITDSPRELVFSSTQTPGEVEELVNAALGASSNVLSLTDEKGRRFVVNAAKIAYVEIGVADARRVGFRAG
jgi:hypothetical protein